MRLKICADLMRERDALKAKLAEAEIQRRVANLNNEGNLARAEKAEAEAAVLREALEWYREFENYVCRNDVEFNYFVVADGGERARVALSQRGPGAALLERVKKPCPKCGHRNEELP